MSHVEPDGENCKNYFKYGKSFPDNVKDALENIPYGATGPMGPTGPAGSGVYQIAQVPDILDGVNGTEAAYINASGWFHASNQYSPLVRSNISINNSSYTPDAADYNFFDITINGACTLTAPDNMKNGRTITIVIRQGDNGNHTLDFDSIYHFDGGYATLSPEEGDKDVLVATKINDFIFSTIASDVRQATAL